MEREVCVCVLPAALTEWGAWPGGGHQLSCLSYISCTCPEHIWLLVVGLCRYGSTELLVAGLAYTGSTSAARRTLLQGGMSVQSCGTPTTALGLAITSGRRVSMLCPTCGVYTIAAAGCVKRRDLSTSLSLQLGMMGCFWRWRIMFASACLQHNECTMHHQPLQTLLQSHSTRCCGTLRCPLCMFANACDCHAWTWAQATGLPSCSPQSVLTSCSVPCWLWTRRSRPKL